MWASPDYKRDPKEIFNPKIFYLAITIAFAGCSYGFDREYPRITGCTIANNFQRETSVVFSRSKASNMPSGLTS